MKSSSKVLKGARSSQIPREILPAVFPVFTRTQPPARAEDTEERAPDAAEPLPPDEAPAPPADPPAAAAPAGEMPLPPGDQQPAFREEAERVLADAQREAEASLRDAGERAREIEAEARERGYQTGIAAAREAQHALLAEVETLRTHLEEERERFLENLEPEVVRLSLAVAEKIIRQEVTLHPEIVVGVAHAAIARLKDARSLRLRAHPADVETLHQHLAGALPENPAAIEIQAGAHINPGGCLVESERGSVDARLEQQFERTAAALLEDAGE